MSSIKEKTGLIFLVFFILFGALSYGIQRVTIYPYFRNLEHEEAKKNLYRSLEVIYSEIDRIDSLCRDWASWDDTYDFLGSNPDLHLQNHLVPKTFVINRLNIIFIYNSAGNMVWGDSYDLAIQERMASLDSLKTKIQASPSLLFFNADTWLLPKNGILVTDPFPILITSHPIIKNSAEGPKGHLIFGRFLTPELVEEFSEQAEFDFDILPIQGETVSIENKEIAGQLNSEKPQLLQADSDAYLHAYTMVSDIDGEKALLVSSKIPSKILQAGSRAMRYALISMLIAGVLIFFGMRFILQRAILAPVSNLTNHMILVGKTGDLSSRLSLNRRDEIGVLGKEFEGMLEKLEEKDKELIKANSKLEEEVKERQRLINELKQALSEVKTLSGLLPICSGCKKIRDDKGYWNKLESYLYEHSDAQLSHGICPDCVKKLYPDVYEEMYGEKSKKKPTDNSRE